MVFSNKLILWHEHGDIQCLNNIISYQSLCVLYICYMYVVDAAASVGSGHFILAKDHNCILIVAPLHVHKAWMVILLVV